MRFIKRHEARSTPDYLFEIDEWDEGLVVHFEFRNFTPTTLRRAHQEWDVFRSVVTAPLFAIGPSHEDDKWRRFITRFGFKPHSTVLCNNGAERSLYLHTVNE